MFTASTSKALETLELRKNNKIIIVIVDSGASGNLMSEHVFHSLVLVFLVFWYFCISILEFYFI